MLTGGKTRQKLFFHHYFYVYFNGNYSGGKISKNIGINGDDDDITVLNRKSIHTYHQHQHPHLPQDSQSE